MSRSIYVIKSEIAVKIGVATDVKHRFQAMLTGSAIPLTLEYVGECQTNAALEIETAAHKLLEDHHHRGEWFVASVEEAIDAIRQSASDLGHEIQSEIQSSEIYYKARHSQTGTPVYVRLQEEPLAALDDWRRHQADLPGRSEAIRRILEAALKKKTR